MYNKGSREHRIAGQGVKVEGSTSGDHVACITVRTPKVDADALKLIEELD